MASKADKLQKKALRDQQKRIKPGECQKYIRLVLDPEILASSSAGLGQQLQIEIERLELKYEIRNLPAKKCIIWERQAANHELLPIDRPEQFTTTQWKMVNQVVQLHTGQELHKNQVTQIAEHLKTSYPEAKTTVVVLAKQEKNAGSNTLAATLIDFQVMHQVATLQVAPTATEVAAMLRRFTKAIAEAPYKQQKADSLGAFKKFLANDKKQCVRVVGTNGFGRLWQQHLNRLPLVTLEVAESIIAQYPCPKQLLDAYKHNGEEENRKIAELKISRGGPQTLNTERRIGNMLSGKLHILYNSRDPNAII